MIFLDYYSLTFNSKTAGQNRISVFCGRRAKCFAKSKLWIKSGDDWIFAVLDTHKRTLPLSLSANSHAAQTNSSSFNCFIYCAEYQPRFGQKKKKNGCCFCQQSSYQCFLVLVYKHYIQMCIIFCPQTAWSVQFPTKILDEFSLTKFTMRQSSYILCSMLWQTTRLTNFFVIPLKSVVVVMSISPSPNCQNHLQSIESASASESRMPNSPIRRTIGARSLHTEHTWHTRQRRSHTHIRVAAHAKN